MVWKMMEKPSLITQRNEPSPHYEVHYSDRVEFWTVDLETKIGESKIEDKGEFDGWLLS